MWRGSQIMDFDSVGEDGRDPEGDSGEDWEVLVEDTKWRVDRGIGSLPFLDSTGFRYYVPALMTIALRGGLGDWLYSNLVLPKDRKEREWRFEQWSLLNAKQRCAVRHFIEHMVDRYIKGDDKVLAEAWSEALDSYWKDILCDGEAQELREAILAEIRRAFEGVTREGGVSWSETVVIDAYGTNDERAEARSLDRDRSWTELLDDATFPVERGVGGLAFLDPIGVRYYLPALMSMAVLGRPSDSLLFNLTLHDDKVTSFELNQWSLLDVQQRRCVKHFIECMIRLEERGDSMDAEGNGGWTCYEAEQWRAALTSYWKDAVVDTSG